MALWPGTLPTLYQFYYAFGTKSANEYRFACLLFGFHHGWGGVSAQPLHSKLGLDPKGSTRARSSRSIEYEYEYHFIKYEYEVKLELWVMTSTAGATYIMSPLPGLALIGLAPFASVAFKVIVDVDPVSKTPMPEAI